jgi:hypothetical protein
MEVPMHGMRSRAALLAAVALLGAGSLAACGDDDDEGDSSAESTEAADTEEVTLTADEYTFELSATPTAETQSVEFDNQGKEGHFLVFAKINEGFTLEEAVKLEGKKGSAEVLIEDGAGPGETKTFEVEGPIEPGEYAMLCPIPSPEGPHYELGQLQEFSIE